MVAFPSFTHLHVHSHYSLLDGAITVQDLVAEAGRCEMGALALTDHGNLFGAIEFYSAAKAAGIRPIVGCEAYLVDGDARSPAAPGEPLPRYHVTLLARDRTGFANLSRLSSLSWTQGYQRKPRIDLSMLAAHGQGLIALTGCLSGRVARPLQQQRLDLAIRAAEEYAEILGRENVYLEVMSNGLEAQRVVREGMPAVARATGLKLVATNDIHYRCEGDSKAQDALICIGTGQKMRAPDRRFRIETNELYFRTSAEMAGLFGADSEAYRSTAEIAERCDLQLELHGMHLPRFPIPSGESAPDFLRRLCEEGLRKRYGSLDDRVRNRFETEFQVIESMGFVHYFLIVWDLIRHARDMGIPVGPGRGSAAGSIVSYALEITQLCPLRYGLLFERFLNADRVSMPDIDIDFCRDRREEVIEYARRKYGSGQVCQIVTFGTLAARAAIRDAGRVLDIPLPDVDRIAKRIPEAPGTRLRKALDADEELRTLIGTEGPLRELMDVSLAIEGMVRNTSTHAAGVVITDGPLIDHVPLCVVQGAVNTQFQMTDLEKIGLLKMDFLGLKNLTILEQASRLVARTTGRPIDYEQLPLDDRATYELLKTGDTWGVFQLESAGMRELIVKLQPDSFDDIVALIALYRPGPLQSGMVDSFVNRKHGSEPIQYAHPLMEPILRDTYGAMVYQEQVMRLAQTLGGLSLNKADELRKAMGKKNMEAMQKHMAGFLQGCAANGIAATVARKVWDDMARFAEYGFNKSHSVAYGLITFRTAYMRAHHPGEYLAALMSCDAGDTDRLAEYAEAARRAGWQLLAPDVNASQAEFTLEGQAIRMGLGAVKGVGGRAVEAVLAARRAAGGRVASLGQWLDHLDGRALHRAALDALVKAGTFDSLHANRVSLLGATERLLREASRAQADRAMGQASLFGGATVAAPVVALEASAPPTPADLYAMEKEALGFAVTADPMADHRELMALVGSHAFDALRGLPDRADVLVGGMIANLRITVSGKGRNQGKPMGMFRVQGPGGSCAAVAFSSTFARQRDLIQDDAVRLFRGRIDNAREEPSLLIDEIFAIDDAAVCAGRRLLLDLRADRVASLPAALTELDRILRRHAGPTETFLFVTDADGARSGWRLPADARVSIRSSLLRELTALLGRDALRLR